MTKFFKSSGINVFQVNNYKDVINKDEKAVT